MDYNTALQNQLTIVSMLAPNGKAQAYIAKMVNRMSDDGESPSDVLVQVILFVGHCLRNQKWPEA